VASGTNAVASAIARAEHASEAARNGGARIIKAAESIVTRRDSLTAAADGLIAYESAA
jgi:hypothetical protein